MEQYTEINRMFWNGSPFQWVFYASVLLILIFEKRKVHKLVFGVFPVVMLVGIFNPVTSGLVYSVFRYSNKYYVRFFSVIPVFYCMAHGVTMLLDRAPAPAKLLGVCAAVGLIAFGGNCVYREPWMQRAENLQKTPDEVIKIIDALPREKENPRVAFPDPLYVYARQVDGSLLMPYGRQLRGRVSPLLEALNNPVPDADTVITLAGNEDVDYVVVKRSDEAMGAFAERGYTPVGQTRDYCVYPVTGVQRTQKTLNEKRQVVSTVALDADGNPTYSNISVVSAREYTYDRWGNQVEERYYGKDGQRVTTTEGYSGRKRSYMLHGMAWLISSNINLDTEDRPVLTSGRYETRYRYLQRRDLIEERYYDAGGKPMNRLDTGYGATLKQYDEKGRLVSEKFSDASGGAGMCRDGYAGYILGYDDRDRVTTVKYLDSRGAPLDNAAGFAEWRMAYDKGGNLVKEAFLNQSGSAVDIHSRVRGDTASDLLQRVKKEDVADSVGLSYSWNADGSCTVTGDAKGISWNNILVGDRPFYFINGQTYRVEYASEKVCLCIYFYEDLHWINRIALVEGYGDNEFTVPQNCRAMIIRLWVAPGSAVNETVHPRIYVKGDAA